MPCRMESGRSMKGGSGGGWNRTIDLRAMTPASYQLLHPAIFRAFNATIVSHRFVFILMPTSFVAQALGSAGLNLFAKQIFIDTLEKISRKKKDSNLRYALTYATLAMWCFRPLSHSSVLPPSSRLSPVYALVRRYYLRMNKRSFVIPSYI